jgi:small-conductance mechanosensitive channel
MRLSRAVALLLLLLAVPLSHCFAQAQSQPQAQPPALAALEPARQSINEIEAALRGGGLSVNTLFDFSRRIIALRGELRDRILDLEPQLARADTRLKQLGAPPAPGAAAEPAAIATERHRLEQIHANIDAALKQARLLAARADQAADRLTEQRRAVYSQELFEHGSSILSPFFWTEIALAMPAAASRFSVLAQDWWRVVTTHGGLPALAAALVLATVFVSALVWLRRWLRRRLFAAPRTTRLSKALIALGVLANSTATAPLGVAVFGEVLDAFGIYTRAFDELLIGLGVGVLVAAFGRGVALAVLAPATPERRLYIIGDAHARALSRHMIAGARLLGIAVFLLLFHKTISAPHVLTLATNALLALGIGALLLNLVLRGPPADWSGAGEAPRTLWLRGVAWLLIAGIALALVLGFANFAAFIAERLLATAAVTGSLYLVYCAADALFTETIAAESPRGRAIAGQLGINARRVSLFGTLASGVVCLILILVGFVLIVGPWEVTVSDFFEGVKTASFGIRIGEFYISLGTILSAMAMLALILFITRMGQRWLEVRLLPRTELESSLQQSIVTICGYIGIIIAIAVTLAEIGINLQNIALIAGALSVGIGFGLQSIVSNFVSGLIILAERPIRVGDLITVKGDEGRVRRISVRATEIETGDRASVIVPNSELVTGIVKNRTRADASVRSAIKIGVGYGSDPEKVREILLACAREHPKVWHHAEPVALLTNFGDSALEFELSFVAADVGTSANVSSDIRFALLKRLGEAGVDIPYPHRVVHQADSARDMPRPASKTAARPRRG